MPLRKSPVSYQEFVETGVVRKKTNPAVEPDPDNHETPDTAKPEAAKQTTRDRSSDQQAPKTPSLTHEEAKPKVADKAKGLLTIDAPFPAQGVSPAFDLLSRTYPQDKAIALILRKAMPLYEKHLLSGTFKTLPTNYHTQPGSFRTKRTVSEKAFKIAKKQRRPFGHASEPSVRAHLCPSGPCRFF
ncbi:VirC2 family conjugal transfer protein [Labrenzia sp. DG1229]|uniref:VirC2 family conjugal transfer protein n=1 Tax=Labrenzia sp. DG1229 TaxID=681847 RepID=UPI00048A847A|nr:VirC2 family conjugal transfer protein [Labrenzia sp. DG1229]